MRSIPAAIALLMVILTISATAALFEGRSNVAQGEVRCEGVGAIVISIEGTDYAVNGMAIAVIPRYSAFGTTPLIPKVISTALSSQASHFVIGDRREPLRGLLTPALEIEITV